MSSQYTFRTMRTLLSFWHGMSIGLTKKTPHKWRFSIKLDSNSRRTKNFHLWAILDDLLLQKTLMYAKVHGAFFSKRSSNFALKLKIARDSNTLRELLKVKGLVAITATT